MPKKDKSEQNKETVLMLAQTALSGVILYDQVQNNAQIHDQFVFADPEDDTKFLYMRILGLRVENRYYPSEIYVTKIDPAIMVASIANGNYAKYESIDIESRTAKRTLKIYNFFIQCCIIRGSDVEFFKEDEKLDSNQNSVQVE